MGPWLAAEDGTLRIAAFEGSTQRIRSLEVSVTGARDRAAALLETTDLDALSGLLHR